MKASDTHRLPRTGLGLTSLGLGCAPLGNLFRRVTDEQAHATIAAAWDAGIRYADTAPFYGLGLSEHRLGRALRDAGDGAWVVSTKVGRLLRPKARVSGAITPPQKDTWVDPLPFVPAFDYSASGIRRSLDDSLQRLGVAHVHMALVHDIGQLTHGDQHAHYWHQLTQGGGFRELERLRDEGLIGNVGLGVNEWEVALCALEHTDLDCVLLAGRYTLLEQGALHPFLNIALQRSVGVVIGGPFNSGILAAAPGADAPFNYGKAPASVLARVEQLRAACQPFGVPLAAAALQFPLAHPAVVSCIPGIGSAQQLREVVKWFETPLHQEFWQHLRNLGLLNGDTPLPGFSTLPSP